MVVMCFTLLWLGVGVHIGRRIGFYAERKTARKVVEQRIGDEVLGKRVLTTRVTGWHFGRV